MSQRTKAHSMHTKSPYQRRFGMCGMSMMTYGGSRPNWPNQGIPCLMPHSGKKFLERSDRIACLIPRLGKVRHSQVTFCFVWYLSLMISVPYSEGTS